MTTATAPAVEKRKKPWTKARVIDLIIDIFCFVIVGAASLTCILPFIHSRCCRPPPAGGCRACAGLCARLRKAGSGPGCGGRPDCP